MHLALEAVAAFSTLGLLRMMRVGWVASTLAAVVFGLNGSFSVMTNAPFNPIAFLPAALFGVELVARAVLRGRPLWPGVWVLAGSTAAMLFSGFPETVMLEGLLVIVWVIVRWGTLRDGRRRLIVGCGGAGLLGFFLAAPVLISFKDFLD